MIGLAKKIILSKLGFPRPISGVFWVTNRCNSKCKMCGIWHSKKKEDINIERFRELFSKSKILKSLNSITFTGGEPFLRNDLDEFIDVVLKYAKPTQIRISTNGFLTDRILKFMENMLNKHKKINFGVKVSLDGIGEMHNKMRGVPKAFNKAMKTLESLNQIKKVYRRLHLGVSFTVTSKNFNEINEIRELALKNKWEFFYKPYMKAELYNNKSDNELFVNPEQINYLIKFNKKLFFDLKKQNILVRLVDKNYYKLLIEYFKNPKRLIKCYAGFSSFHINSDGNVLPCQALDLKMGNVNEQNFDNIWFGKKAKEVRSFIKKSNCHCVTACDTSISIIVGKFPFY